MDIWPSGKLLDIWPSCIYMESGFVSRPHLAEIILADQFVDFKKSGCHAQDQCLLA